MSMQPNPVSGGEKAGGSNGTPSQLAGSQVQGTPQQPTPDANAMVAQLTELQGKYAQLEQDRRNQQARYDQKIAQLQRENQERQNALTQQLRQTAMSGMDDAAKQKYEAETAKADLDNLRQQYQTLQEQIAMQQQINTSVGFFRDQFGIDPSVLDTTSVEGVANSGWQAAVAALQALKAEVENLKKNPQGQAVLPNAQPGRQPQPVLTTPAPSGTPQGTSSPLANFVALRQSVEQQTGRRISDADLFRMLDSGQLDPSVLFAKQK